MYGHIRPMPGFWFYVFERYNGVLGSMPNNKRFSLWHDLLTLSFPFPNNFGDDFKNHFHLLLSDWLKQLQPVHANNVKMDC